jgi:hypothetical protein
MITWYKKSKYVPSKYSDKLKQQLLDKDIKKPAFNTKQVQKSCEALQSLVSFKKQTFDISQFDVKDVFIDYENRKIVIRF